MLTRSIYPFLNILGFLGYFSCLLQWALLLLPFLPGMLDSGVFRTFMPSGPSETVVSAPSPPVLPNWLVFIVVAAIVLAVVAATVMALARLPRAIGQAGQSFTRTAAEHVIPLVTHHATLPEKKRRALTARIVFNIKLAVLALPLIIALVVPLPDASISRQLLLVVVALAAGWSLLLFCVQAACARMFKVSLDRLW